MLNCKPFADFTRPKPGLPDHVNINPPVSVKTLGHARRRICRAQEKPHVVLDVAQTRSGQPNRQIKSFGMMSDDASCWGNGDQPPPPKSVSALQSRIAQAPVTATLLNPLEIAERAVILVLTIRIDAGLQAGLARSLA